MSLESMEAEFLEAQKKGRTKALIVAAVIGALVVGGAFALFGGDKKEVVATQKVVEEPEASIPEQLEARFGVKFVGRWFDFNGLVKQADAAPCDPYVAKRLADELIKRFAYEATIKHVDTFMENCEGARNVQWKRLHANKKLKRWDAALVDANDLIAQVPSDNSFWWWRAEIQQKSGKLEQAIYDYWQSSALSPNSGAAKRISWLPERIGSHFCTAAFVVKRYIAVEQPSHHSWQRTLTELYAGGQCEEQAGRGSTTLKLSADGTASMESVKIRGGANASLRLLLDPYAGYTVVTESAASAAGLDWKEGTDISIRVLGQFTDAKVVEASEIAVRGAKARKLKVAVVESLPGDVQGVLGANFLWRFDIEVVKKGLKISP